MKQRLKDMHVGRLIHILSHSMRRHNPTEVIENDDLTTMQKHVLKFILLETMHRDLYQKDVEEEFQVRKPTATGILKLMEKNGYIYRESARQDARLKRIVPTEKAENIRPAILKSIEENEEAMVRGIPKEDLQKITEAFYMVDKSRSRKEHGAGLGLALAVKIAKLHHTELVYESVAGQGTCVSFMLAKEADDEEEEA